MLFLLIFLCFTNNVYSQSQLYDNTMESTKLSSTISTVEPCQVEKTEHFTQKANVLIPGKLSLSSSRLIQNIVDHFLFLIEIEQNILWSNSARRWYVKLPIQKVYEYTQLQFDDLSVARDACHSFLLIKKNESMVCRLDGEIIFTKSECSNIIERMVRNPPLVTSSMVTIQDDIVYTFLENPNGSIKFADVNDDSLQTRCKAYISNQIMENLLNILSGTGVVFPHYERMVEAIFPVPHCQILMFNIPTQLRHENNILYYIP